MVKDFYTALVVLESVKQSLIYGRNYYCFANAFPGSSIFKGLSLNACNFATVGPAKKSKNSGLISIKISI